MPGAHTTRTTPLSPTHLSPSHARTNEHPLPLFSLARLGHPDKDHLVPLSTAPLANGHAPITLPSLFVLDKLGESPQRSQLAPLFLLLTPLAHDTP